MTYSKHFFSGLLGCVLARVWLICIGHTLAWLQALGWVLVFSTCLLSTSDLWLTKAVFFFSLKKAGILEGQTNGVYICAKLLQSCPTLCNPMDHSPPEFSVLWILQAKILEWLAILFSRRYPGTEPRSSALQADSLPSEPPGKPNRH